VASASSRPSRMLVRQWMSRGIIGPNGAAKAHAMQFRISLSLPKVVRADDVSVHDPLCLSGVSAASGCGSVAPTSRAWSCAIAAGGPDPTIVGARQVCLRGALRRPTLTDNGVSASYLF
jgi:hypothetical protein